MKTTNQQLTTRENIEIDVTCPWCKKPVQLAIEVACFNDTPRMAFYVGTSMRATSTLTDLHKCVDATTIPHNEWAPIGKPSDRTLWPDIDAQRGKTRAR